MLILTRAFCLLCLSLQKLPMHETRTAKYRMSLSAHKALSFNCTKIHGNFRYEIQESQCNRYTHGCASIGRAVQRIISWRYAIRPICCFLKRISIICIALCLCCHNECSFCRHRYEMIDSPNLYPFPPTVGRLARRPHKKHMLLHVFFMDALRGA